MRERTQIILLAAEQGIHVPDMTRIVRRNDWTVRTWIKRFSTYGADLALEYDALKP